MCPRNNEATGSRLAIISMPLVERSVLIVLVGLVTIWFTLFALDLARGTPAVQALNQAGQGFVDYITNLIHGDLGKTSSGGPTSLRRPVSCVLAETLPRSIGLLGITMGVSMLVGIFVGILAATSAGRFGSSVILVLSTLGVSIPSFFLALLFQMLVVKITRTFGYSILPTGGFGWDGHFVLPAMVLAARPLAQIARITYLKTRETMDQNFVRTALSKGLNIGALLRRHIARNIAIPVLTTAAVSLRFALGGLPIVEAYFGWPGAGLKLLRAISNQDDNLTVALLLSLALFFIIIQLFLEASYRLFDPRVGEIAHMRNEQRPSIRGAAAAMTDIFSSLMEHTMGWLRYVGQSIRRYHPAWPTFQLPSHRYKQGLRHLLKRLNIPLLVGGSLCLGLLVVIFFGSRLAPHDPYRLVGLEKVDGTWMAPPFEPSRRFPWGTDALGRGLLSLILTGAQQTLFLASVAVAFRMLIGTVLGIVAGWWRGSLLDRAITGLAQTIKPFPIVLLTMLIILAVGIRQGVLPFVVGLCAVGWGELEQFIRAEVMALRSRPFVESTKAMGATSPHILAFHIFPHLAPSLMALLAMEFAGVLILLAELGFLGIFLGGGAYMEMEMFKPPLHYSDVPEWGSLLANFRQAAQSKPWLGIYPSLAIFVSALGFQLMGEGIRLEIERGHIFLKRILNRYTLTIGAIAALILYLLSGNLGSGALYRQYANQFDVDAAMSHVSFLTQAELGGREVGTPGAEASADWIADTFDGLGLQAIGQDNSYFLETYGGVERLTGIPVLELSDEGPPLQYTEDFAEYVDQFRCLGEVEGRIRFVSFGESPSWGRMDVSSFRNFDLSQDVIMVLSPEEAELLSLRECAGVLVVANDPDMIRRSSILSPESRVGISLSSVSASEDRPSFWISEEIAERILAGSDFTLDQLRKRVPEIDARDPLTFVLPSSAHMKATGKIEQDLEIRHVIGWIPGLKGNPRDQMDDKVIAILAQYDTAPSRPGSGASQGANNNASGIAVLLEVCRLLTQTEYWPNRSFLVVARSVTGWNGGELRVEPDAQWFLDRSSLPAQFFDIEAVLRLRGLGTGTSSSLAVETSGGMRLSNLLRSSASSMGERMAVVETPTDLSTLFSGKSIMENADAAPEAILSCQGWQEATQPSDPFAAVTPENLGRAGRVASFAAMILGREARY